MDCPTIDNRVFPRSIHASRSSALGNRSVAINARRAGALQNAGIRTLADLTVRVPRRRRWWAGVSGLGARGAHQIKAFCAAEPALTERARALVAVPSSTETAPWEHMVVPQAVDGSRGTFRAPQATCALSASNAHEAVKAWLGLQDAGGTQRAYQGSRAAHAVGHP